MSVIVVYFENDDFKLFLHGLVFKTIENPQTKAFTPERQ